MMDIVGGINKSVVCCAIASMNHKCDFSTERIE